jgi:glycosyltransferase involved in cell wall biosynthesis
MPAISVIVPVYKVAPWLPDCAGSVLAQTFTDFECVLVDDGSPDNCPAICDEYAAKDARVRVIHQKNSGVTGARKAGVEKARGTYICFLDGDDMLPPGALSLLFDRAASYDLDILISAKTRIINNKRHICENEITGIIPREKYFEATLLGQCAIGPCGRLTKRKLFGPETFDIPRIITNNEDLVMNLRLGLGAEKIGVFNDLVTYDYCIRKNSASSKLMGYELWSKLFGYCDEVIHTLPRNEALENAFVRFKLRRMGEAAAADKKITKEAIDIARAAKKLDRLDQREKRIIAQTLHYRARFFIYCYFMTRKILAKIFGAGKRSCLRTGVN